MVHILVKYVQVTFVTNYITENTANFSTYSNKAVDPLLELHGYLCDISNIMIHIIIFILLLHIN